jgi:hypothetical protein
VRWFCGIDAIGLGLQYQSAGNAQIDSAERVHAEAAAGLRGTMNPEAVKTAAQARQIVESRGAAHVKVGMFDMDGILRGKYMSR